MRKAEAGQGQGDCQAGPGREVCVRAWLSAIARLRASHGASWGRVALARPSGNVLVLLYIPHVYLACIYQISNVSR